VTWQMSTSMAKPRGAAATSWSVRRAREQNLAEINRVITASKSYWDYPVSYLEAALPLLMIDRSYLAAHLCFEVVDERSAVVCFFAITGDAEDADTHLLDHLWVRPDLLGQGVGRLACKHVFSLARRHRWPALRVLPDPPAGGFYRTLGFHDTGARVKSRVPDGPSFSVLEKNFETVTAEGSRAAGRRRHPGSTAQSGA